MSEKALQGIKVLDFTSVLSGPYCSMMLGNMGAEIYEVKEYLRSHLSKGA